MKVTKVIFEHQLNDNAQKARALFNQDEMKCLDEYFSVWIQSGTHQGFGTWLRRCRPAEFIRRHTQWKNLIKEKSNGQTI